MAAVVDTAFSWGNDAPLNIPWHQTVIYETHVRSLTMEHPDIPEAIRGTVSSTRCEFFIIQLKFVLHYVVEVQRAKPN